VRPYHRLLPGAIVGVLVAGLVVSTPAKADVVTQFVSRGCHAGISDYFCDPNGPPKGTIRYLNGEPFRFNGINIYNANSNGWCWYPMDGTTLDDSLAAISTQGGVFRAWFFQQLATTNGVRDWTGFDRTLAAARRHGFRVIATLIDQWGDCGASTTPGYGYKTDTWYRSGYMQPDPIGTTSYLGWAGEVATRYRDDPTILAWQLVNEAEVKTAQNGPCAADAAQVLKTFAGNASGVIRGTDPNHLISLGTIGTGQCGAQGAEYSDVHSVENIDLCEYHDYSPNEAMPGDIYNGLQVRINQCNALDKPLFVGESGIRPMDVGGTLGARARAFQAKFERQFEAGVVGELVWAWDKNGSLTDNYDIGPGDPALGVISGTTSLMGIESFAISNDGRRLALSAERNGVEGLYLADRDGTNAVFLAADSHPLRPYFTPNDDQIVYYGSSPAGPGVFIVPVSGASPPRRLTDPAVIGEESPSLSRDGTKVVAVGPDASSGTLSTIRVIDISGPTPVDSEVFDGYPNLAPQDPAFSADGSTIVFGAVGFPGPAYSQVASITASGGIPTQLTHFTGDGDEVAAPQVSFAAANLGQVMFVHIDNTSTALPFYTMNLDGTNMVQAATVVPPGNTRVYGGDIRWTPNGQIARMFTWYDDRTTRVVEGFGIPQVPLQPRTSPVAAAGDGMASVSWSTPRYDGGLPITSYTVTSSPAAAPITVGASSTTATMNGLANGTSYTFTVTAANAEGKSVGSGASNTVTPRAGAGPPASIQQPVAGGSTVTTDTGSGPTTSQPVTTTLTMPSSSPGGIASITQTSITEPAPTGFSLVGQQIQISAPAANPGSPLALTFALDASATSGQTAATLQIYRTEGSGAPTQVGSCIGSPGTASPDPCVSSRIDLAGGDIQLTVLTSSASVWNLALDTTAPTVSFSSPADGATFKLRQTSSAAYSCADLGSGIASCSALVASGTAIDTSSVGTKTFSVAARDRAGNSRTVTHTYKVIFDFAGFFSPISNPPVLNSVKAGSVVIESFILAGNQGMGIIASGYPRVQTISCTSLAASGSPMSVVGTLHYGSAAYGTRYYEQWTSSSSWASTCRQVTIRLSDDTDHVAYFKFTK